MSAKTLRSFDLANGKTTRRRFPKGEAAFLVASDSEWTGANVYWCGTQDRAMNRLAYMQKLHSGDCHHAGKYPNARIIKVECPA